MSRSKPLRKDLLDYFDHLAGFGQSTRWVNLNGQLASQYYLTARFEDGIYKSSKFDPAWKCCSRSLGYLGHADIYLFDRLCWEGGERDTFLFGDLVMWQAAFAGHPADKHKELIGGIGMLRLFTTIRKIVPAEFRNAVLVIDGTWQQDQIQRLGDNGFVDLLRR